jgi:MoxR-like ATPase
MNPGGPREGDAPKPQVDESAPGVPEIPLSEAAQETIGRSLRAYYEDIAKEPIPDRFLALLAQLEAQELKEGRREP